MLISDNSKISINKTENIETEDIVVNYASINSDEERNVYDGDVKNLIKEKGFNTRHYTKQEIDELFPYNKETDAKFMVYWDDVMQYTTIGFIIVLKKMFGFPDHEFVADLFFERHNDFIDGIDFVYHFFDKLLTREELKKIYKECYFQILKHSPISNTLMSILRTMSYSKHIMFVFKHDEEKFLNSLIDDININFNPFQKCKVLYTTLDDFSENDIFVNFSPNVIFCNDINKWVSYIFENEVRNIEIFGPENHNGLSKDFKKVYFDKLKGSFLPYGASVKLFVEQIAL